jgi:hypothetical protein
MKNLLNYKTLIKVAIMIVVIALIGSQMMDTDAGRGKKKWKKDECNDTSGGGNTGEACDLCDVLERIEAKIDTLLEGNGGNGGTPSCICDEIGLEKSRDGNWGVRVPDELLTEACNTETNQAWTRTVGNDLTWLEASEFCRDIGPGWDLPTMNDLFAVAGIELDTIVFPWAGVWQMIWSSIPGEGQDVHWVLAADNGGEQTWSDDDTTPVTWCVKPCDIPVPPNGNGTD